MSELMDDAVDPVSRESTAAIIADQLRGLIMRGAFPPGCQLAELDLASRLGVGRGPLREAMQRLVAEGLLRSERHRGLFVIDLDIGDVRDVYAARLAVEQAAAQMVLRTDRSAAITELVAAQDRIVAAAASRDPTALADADQEFHTALVRVSGSPRLQRMANILIAETRMCLTALQATKPSPEELVSEHRALLDAVREGHAQRLRQLLAGHMSSAVARIEHDQQGLAIVDNQTTSRLGASMAQLSPLLKQATPILATRGEGVYLYDAQDRRYLDFTAGIGVTSTGHCHPRVVEAAQRQAGRLIHGQYTTVLHEPLLTLTQRLGEVLPAGLDALFYVNSGSEAVEAALRLARHATGRQNAVVFSGSFHGRTMGAAALTTSGTRFRAGIGPLMPAVAVAPFPFAFRYGWSEQRAVDFALAELDMVFATTSPAADTAAIFIEPVLGEGGYVPAPPAFLAGLRVRADEHGICLVVDEVQTGFGRTGRFWGHQHAGGVRPDIVVTAKGLASGFPLSAIAASTELMSKAWPGSQGGTYGGNAVSCAAAIATLDVIRDENLVENAAEQGRRLAEGLRKVAADHPVIADVRGLGLMLGCEFCHPDGSADAATAVRAQRAAAVRGLLLLTCGVHGNVVRMIPALVVTADQIDEAVTLWAHAVVDAVS